MSAIERLRVVVDSSNHYFATQKVIGRNLNLPRLVHEVCKDRGQIVDRYIYSGLDPQNKHHINFLNTLENRGWKVRTQPLREIAPGKRKEKGVDTLLALDTAEGAWENEYDCLVLFSGDGDFEVLVNRVRKAGKKVVVAQFRNFLSNALAEAADDVVHLDDMFCFLSWAA